MRRPTAVVNSSAQLFRGGAPATPIAQSMSGFLIFRRESPLARVFWMESEVETRIVRILIKLNPEVDESKGSFHAYGVVDRWYARNKPNKV